MKTHKLLWTGGWDSTFRLLDLVINKKRIVQPYYILDRQRNSTQMEMKTMDEIKDMIEVVEPGSKNKILGTIEIEKNMIPSNSKITESFNIMLAELYLGSQYDWLSRYADSNKINDLELSIHSDDKATAHIVNNVKEVFDGNDSFYKLNEDATHTDLFIFSYFNYPLLNMSKLDMEKISKKSGFLHIMENTWFCHSPLKGKPCGMCKPCQYTRDEGLGRRVPKPSLKALLTKRTRHVIKKVIPIR